MWNQILRIPLQLKCFHRVLQSNYFNKMNEEKLHLKVIDGCKSEKKSIASFCNKIKSHIFHNVSGRQYFNIYIIGCMMYFHMKNPNINIIFIRAEILNYEKRSNRSALLTCGVSLYTVTLTFKLNINYNCKGFYCMIMNSR